MTKTTQDKPQKTQWSHVLCVALNYALTALWRDDLSRGGNHAPVAAREMRAQASEGQGRRNNRALAW